MSFASVRVAIRLCLTMAAMSWAATPARAQGEYQVLQRFERVSRQIPGLTLGPDGALYGIAPGEFRTATVYKIGLDGTYVRLAEFSGTFGYDPPYALTLGPGGLYGTTFWDGALGMGTVFRVTPDGALTTLHSFTGVEGSHPSGPLALGHDGALYGVTRSGAAGYGGVFRVDASGAVTLLHAFTATDNGDGQFPGDRLSVGTDGAMYGVIGSGGTSRRGLVYRVRTNGEFTRLHTFQDQDGSWPYGPPTPTADGVIYGTTSAGGRWNAGTVYRITPDGAFATLHAFDSIDGAGPMAPLVSGGDGQLYGTTFGDYSSDSGMRGSIFRVNSDGTVSLLHVFSGGDGGGPQTALLNVDDRLYGVSSWGGQVGCGTIFSIAHSGAFQSHYSFGCSGDGTPVSALTEGPGGALYGTLVDSVFRWKGADTTPPTIVAELMNAPNANGWYTHYAAVNFTCRDNKNGSGIPEGACPGSELLFTEGTAVMSTPMTVTDAAGNVSLPSNVVVVKVDRTPPTLAPSISSSVVLLNGSTVVNAHASDTLSGLANEGCNPVDTSTVGPRLITCSAVDAAGNLGTATLSYAVQYRFSGFQQPVNDPASPGCAGCALSVFRDGSTIAVRFQLTDAFGAAVVSQTAPRWLPPVQVGTTTARVNEDNARGERSIGTTFQLTGTEYVYNWAPRGLPRGSVWRLGVALDDGQQYTVDVAIR